MKRKGVEGLPADPQESVAANDEFAGEGDGYAHLTHSRSGWDPYDVWRTRVKNSKNSVRVQERDPDSRR